MIFLLVMTLFTESEAQQFIWRQGYLPLIPQECYNPNNIRGICTSLESCNPLRGLLTLNKQNPEVINFIVRSHCGWEGTLPNVCCPVTSDHVIDSYGERIEISEKIPHSPESSENSPSSATPGNMLRPGACGQSKRKPSRSTGRRNATLGSWPWIAAFGYGTGRKEPMFSCSGSLISDRHVLTAAHCVLTSKKIELIRLGDINLSDDSDGATPIDAKVSKVIIHENYDADTFAFDIAIVQLEKPVVFTGGPSNPNLQEVQVPVIPVDHCKDAYSNFRVELINDKVLCAGFLKGEKDVCWGDSGGPLMDYNNKDKSFYQIGILSVGHKCAEPGFPGVYTRVTVFADWILDKIQKKV